LGPKGPQLAKLLSQLADVVWVFFTLLPKQIFMLCRVMTLTLLSMFLCYGTAAQEGHYGVGHEKWHGGFYTKLKRNDGQAAVRPKVAWLATTTRLK
jgi:hypothetical protein